MDRSARNVTAFVFAVVVAGIVVWVNGTEAYRSSEMPPTSGWWQAKQDCGASASDSDSDW